MPTVYLDSPNNSTMFTTCCKVAINDDQEKCPRCREIVTPRTHKERWQHAYGKQKRQRTPDIHSGG